MDAIAALSHVNFSAPVDYLLGGAMAETDHELINLQEGLAGEYSIERELGRGGMGVVYLARELQLDRLVAIKVLHHALRDHALVREGFLREARIAASLSHPHVVPIYRVGESGGVPHLIMAYVVGETLGDRLRRSGPVSPAVGAKIMRDVSWALAYAHGRGIVHRDVKPDNILIEDETGRALVTDFGIARVDRLPVEHEERIVGTAEFMSPEQLSGMPLDGRSDLYSLGVTTFLATTGRMPFGGELSVATMRVRVACAPMTVAEALPSAPKVLADVIDRCLRKEPAERFENAESLGVALQASSIARAGPPEPVREFVMARDPLMPVYLVVSASAVMQLLSVGIGSVVEKVDFVGFLPRTAIIAVAPVIPVALFQARVMRRALRSGFSIADLRRALATYSKQLGVERISEQDITLFQRAGAVVVVMIVVATLVLQLAGAIGLWPPHLFGPWSDVWLGAIAVGSSLGVPVLRTRLSDRLFALRSRLWNSRLGEWIADKLAPPRGSVTPQFAHRPTEITLGAAIADLFASLPDEYKATLGDVEAVVDRLEAHASAARARIDEVELQMTIVGSPALAREPSDLERGAATRELRRAVSALESIRLGLLRLSGGLTDLQPITTALDAARDIEAGLRRLRAGEHEIGLQSAWSKLEGEPLTPA